MEMTTKRLILRSWEENDAADLYALASDPQIGPSAGWPPHKSVEDSLQIIRNVLQTPETYALIWKEDNRLIGSAGLKMGKDSCSEKQDEPELGYWIGRQFWGNGYATEAGERLLRHAFEDLNSNAVWCCYYEGNERSKRVQEKLGFTYVRTDPKGDTLLGYTLPEIENVDSWNRSTGFHPAGPERRDAQPLGLPGTEGDSVFLPEGHDGGLHEAGLRVR